VTREDADAKAHAEFETFSERRRLAAESRGAAENIKALEDLAKALPKARQKRKRGDKS
jgi:hypothetical protein